MKGAINTGVNKMTKTAKQGIKLHKFIASGGNPKDYQCSKGVSAKTIPGIKGRS
jgi:hypothetical protein